MEQKRPAEETSRELPFDGVGLLKQLEMLRAFVVVHRQRKQGLSYADVAPVVGISPTNVSACLKFWSSIGFLSSSGRKLVPTSACVSYADAGASDREQVLGALVKDTWFAEAVSMRMRIQQPLIDDDLHRTIVAAYQSGGKAPYSEKSVGIVVELLVLTKIISHEEEGYVVGESVIVSTRPGGQIKRSGIDVPADKDLVQVRISGRLYAMDRQALTDFIERNAKRLSEEQELT